MIEFQGFQIVIMLISVLLTIGFIFYIRSTTDEQSRTNALKAWSISLFILGFLVSLHT